MFACSISNNELTDYGDDMTAIKAIAGALSVSSSMKKIKVNECELPIDVLKTGVEVDLSGQNLQVEDVIIIAACINVSSSMKKIKVNECELPINVLKTGAEVNLSGQNLRVEDAIIIAACINVSSSVNTLK